MEEDKTLFNEEESYEYDASDKPFDFVEVGIGTDAGEGSARQKLVFPATAGHLCLPDSETFDSTQ